MIFTCCHILRVIRWDGWVGGTCNMHEIEECCIQNLDQKSGKKITFVRPRNRWEDNSKNDFKEMGWEGV